MIYRRRTVPFSKNSAIIINSKIFPWTIYGVHMSIHVISLHEVAHLGSIRKSIIATDFRRRAHA